jgi:hypothetical protein
MGAVKCSDPVLRHCPAVHPARTITEERSCASWPSTTRSAHRLAVSDLLAPSPAKPGLKEWNDERAAAAILEACAPGGGAPGAGPAPEHDGSEGPRAE